MINLMVPTLYVEAMLTRPKVIRGVAYKTGEIVEVPYGGAILGLATGEFSTLVDEESAHRKGLDHLRQYGPDSWFPASLQTLAKLGALIQREQTEAPAN